MKCFCLPQKVYGRQLVSIQEKSSCASFMPRSHYSWEDFSTICIHQCLILRRASEYSRVGKTFQPMTPAFPLDDTIVALHHLHPPPSNLVFPPIFGY
jgi:hypothetical protein